MNCESNANEYSEETRLVDIYNKTKDGIRRLNSKLLMLDRNAKKFELFLETCQPTLTVLHLKQFLPLSVNFDPDLVTALKGINSALKI